MDAGCFLRLFLLIGVCFADQQKPALNRTLTFVYTKFSVVTIVLFCFLPELFT